jgi:hypothetical protein
VGSPVIFKGQLAKVLASRGVELKDGTLLLSGNLNPSITPVDAPPGSLYLSTLTSKQYIKEDSGETVNWTSIESGAEGPPGTPGESWQETFESVSKNLKSKPYALTYTGGVLTSIVYTLGGGLFITKTLGYTGSNLTTIVLSGDTPSGITLTKTLTYTGGVLTGIAYS